jgi:TolB-like protein
VRVNAQLVDAEFGIHLWGRLSFSKLQGEVVTRLADNLNVGSDQG